MTYEDKVEIAAWCRINGPLPLLRPDYYSAQLAALIYNSNLSAKSQHNAKQLEDCLLWGQKPDTLETDIVKAMASAGVAKRKANV